MESAAAVVHYLAETSALPALMEFIRVPALSPLFDSQWKSSGLIEKALEVMLKWALSLQIQGLKHEVVRGNDHPPLLYLEVEGTLSTILLYGHLDKQPAGSGWSRDPYDPVIAEGYLYGRASADDGYALTSMLLAIKTCQELGQPHHHCVAILENEEESGSPHLIPILQSLHIDSPALVLCLDTGAGDYEHLWSAESLRGVLRFDLTAKVMEREMHSGTAGGVVPSPWSVLMELLERLEDAETGRIRLEALNAPIQSDQYTRTVDSLIAVTSRLESIKPTLQLDPDIVQLSLNCVNRPSLTVTGLDGAPTLTSASSVMLPALTIVCSIRLPPAVCGNVAVEAVKAALLVNPPHNAEITMSNVHVDEGWAMSPLPAGLVQASESAARLYFGSQPRSAGRGGSIPFVKALQQLFPAASVLLWGAAGPDSSPHGPDERLNLAYYERVTCCLANLLQAQW